MKKAILIPIIIGSILLVTGGVLFAVGYANHTNKNQPVTNEYKIEDSFDSISIDLDVSTFEIVDSTDGTSRVVFEETTQEYHTYAVENNELKINFIDNKQWYERAFNWGVTKMKVTLYTPAHTFGDSKIKNDTGKVIIPNGFSFYNLEIKESTGRLDVQCSVTNTLKVDISTGNTAIANIKAKNIDIKSSTGKVEISDTIVEEKVKIETSTGRVNLNKLNANELDIRVDTGDIKLTSVLIANDMNIKVSTADVIFDHSDALNITVKTSTGDVKGTLLTPKTFFYHTSTGKVNLPKTTGVGTCNIETSTGDISITIEP